MDDFELISNELTAAENQIFYIDPVLIAYNQWVTRNLLHTFPKKRQAWINTIKQQFKKLYVKVPSSASVLSARAKLLMIKARREETSLLPEQILEIQIDPEVIYNILVQQRVIIENKTRTSHIKSLQAQTVRQRDEISELSSLSKKPKLVLS